MCPNTSNDDDDGHDVYHAGDDIDDDDGGDDGASFKAVNIILCANLQIILWTLLTLLKQCSKSLH